MKLILSLDYEVFFGRHTGSVERCLLAPTEALAKLAMARGIPLVFFVDAGFLLRLRSGRAHHPQLRRDYDLVCRQVEDMARQGHEIQLHVHPHWEDAVWTGEAWYLNLDRYRLHDFAPKDIQYIVGAYTGILRDLAGTDQAFAYRAGGWRLQPFAPLGDALLAHGVRIDSTVFAGGLLQDPAGGFDFRQAPDLDHWRFADDPLRIDEQGAFLEVPISAHPRPPAFFWRLALARKLGGARHRSYGDGAAVELGRQDLIRKLTRPSDDVVSLDGLKADTLEQAYQAHRRAGRRILVVIGHPKAVTPHSLQALAAFIDRRRPDDEFCGYGAFRGLLAEERPEELRACA
jgi:hypothetical protein